MGELKWKNEKERVRGFTDETLALLQRMECANLVRGWPLDKGKAEASIAESYRIADLDVPTFVWKVDITDESFDRAAGAAGEARAAWAAVAARAAGAARAAVAARAAGAAWAARAARAAWAAGAAGEARAAWAARAARAARAAGAAWAAGAAGEARAAWAAVAARAAGEARAAGIDYDFDYYCTQFEFLQHEKGDENDGKAMAIWEQFLIAREAGLGYLADYETGGICYLVPAPQVCVDQQNKFHSEVEPAIWWKDGLKCYFLHGVHFDEPLWRSIVDKTISAKDVLAMTNTEQRMAALRTLGMGYVLDEIGAKSLGVSKAGSEELFLVDGVFPWPRYFLKKQDYSTDRQYVECIGGVGETFTDADEALRWQFQVPKNEFETMVMRA